MGFFPSHFINTFTCKLATMKKLAVILVVFAVIGIALFVSVINHWRHHFYMHGHNVSLQVRESDGRYVVDAYYDRDRTGRVQRYLDAALNAHMFNHGRVDGDITLDDQSHFYIRTRPGRLLIRMDKDANTPEALERMKRMSEGLKIEITN